MAATSARLFPRLDQPAGHFIIEVLPGPQLKMMHPNTGGRADDLLESGRIDAAGQGNGQDGRDVRGSVPARPPYIGGSPPSPERHLAPGGPDGGRRRRCQQLFHCPEQFQSERRAAEDLLRRRVARRAAADAVFSGARFRQPGTPCRWSMAASLRRRHGQTRGAGRRRELAGVRFFVDVKQLKSSGPLA